MTPESVVESLVAHQDLKSMAAALHSAVVLPFLASIAGVKGDMGLVIETDYVQADVIKKTIALNEPRKGVVVPLVCGGLLCTRSVHCVSDAPVCNVAKRKCIGVRKLRKDARCVSSGQCESSCCSFSLFGVNRCKEKSFLRTCLP